MTETFHNLVERGKADYKYLEIEEDPLASNAQVLTLSKNWLKISTIKEEAKFNEQYKKNITKIMKTIAGWKKVRGDGNCYYRAVISSFILKLLHFNTPIQFLYNFLTLLSGLRENINIQEYKESFNIVYAIFAEYYRQNNTGNIEHRIVNFRDIHNRLQDTGFDCDLIRVSRLITCSAYFENQYYDQIAPFVVEDEKEDLIYNILTMGREAEGIELSLLPMGLGIQVNQINLFSDAITNYFPCQYPDDDPRMRVNIICKIKGHYDCLYSKKDLEADQYNIKTRRYYYNI
jgi:Peptidase C65 Otubain